MAGYIFNHVPKTGGTSWLAICRHNLGSSQISPHLAEQDVRLGPVAGFLPYTLIAGHFSLPTQARMSAGRYSMTLLRDPIRTILSAYSFWRHAPQINFVTSKAKELSFADFVRYFEDSPSVILNRFTYHFAGAGMDSIDNNTDGAYLLRAAKHNLSAFDFVGICEEFERSASLLCRELGWKMPTPLPHENRLGSESDLAAIDERTLEILRKCTELDSELYSYGVALFHERERIRQNGTGLQTDGQRRDGDNNNRVSESEYIKPSGFLSFPHPSEGNREATIEAVTASWIQDTDSPMLELVVRFRTKLRIPELVLGVAIFDSEGNHVWGTNTLIEGLRLEHEPLCNCFAAFVVHCGTRESTYSVTTALSRPRRLGFHDHWLDHATSFAVTASTDHIHTEGFRLRQFRSFRQH